MVLFNQLMNGRIYNSIKVFLMLLVAFASREYSVDQLVSFFCDNKAGSKLDLQRISQFLCYDKQMNPIVLTKLRSVR